MLLFIRFPEFAEFSESSAAFKKNSNISHKQFRVFVCLPEPIAIQVPKKVPMKTKHNFQYSGL